MSSADARVSVMTSLSSSLIFFVARGSLNVVTAAGAGGQVTTSDRFIETPLIAATEGAVVTLLNWGVKNFTQSHPLLVNVSGLGWRPSRVELAHSGPVSTLANLYCSCGLLCVSLCVLRLCVTYTLTGAGSVHGCRRCGPDAGCVAGS